MVMVARVVNVMKMVVEMVMMVVLMKVVNH